MGEQESPVVGSVAEEAARLLEALGGWASTAQEAYAAKPADPAADTASDPASDHASDRATAREGSVPDPGGAGPRSRCASCGAEDGAGQAVVCRLCPLCQGIGLLRSVRPETVDRLADLAGAVAAALRDLAAHHAAAHPPQQQPTSRGSRVQDIRIDEDDEDDEPRPGQTGRATP